MMTKLILPVLLCLLVYQTTTHAQDYFIVMRFSGEVSYRAKEGEKVQSIYEGKKLSQEGVIILPNRAQISLNLGGKSIVETKAGAHRLKNYTNRAPQQQTSFLKRFFDHLSEGIKNNDPSDLEKYRQQNVTNTKGGIKGFAGDEVYGIRVVLPVTGVVENDPVVFAWYPQVDSAVYDLQIADFQTGGIIYKALLKDTFIQVELQKLALEPGRKYHWWVEKKQLDDLAIGFSLTEDPTRRTPKVEFVLALQPANALFAELHQEEIYADAPPMDRLLMEAVYLTDKGYLYSAYQTYQKALQAEPKNLLVKQLFATFLAQQGLQKAANDMIAH